MTELVGAVGLAQLGKVKAVVEKRRELCRAPDQPAVSRFDGIEPVPVTDGRQSLLLAVSRSTSTAFPPRTFAADMIRQKIWASAGYTGKPIYLCSESLIAKKTYGDVGVAVHLQSRNHLRVQGGALPAR